MKNLIEIVQFQIAHRRVSSDQILKQAVKKGPGSQTCAEGKTEQCVGMGYKGHFSLTHSSFRFSECLINFISKIKYVTFLPK